MLVHIILATALCLVRCETAEILRKPTPAPPQALILRVWDGTVATPEWWSNRQQQRWRFMRYEVVRTGSHAETPCVQATDPWGHPEMISASATVVREVLIDELMNRAREEAKNPPRKHIQPTPCFPGEYPGYMAQPGGVNDAPPNEAPEG